MGIGVGSDIFSRPLTMIGKVSSRCVTSQAARTRLNVYSVALRQQPANWTLHTSWFPHRGGNLNGPGGSTSPGGKISGAALPYFSLKEVVNPAGVATNLADLRLDTGEGYNRFDTLWGFLSDSLGLKRVKTQKKCVLYNFKLPNVRSVELVMVKE